MESKYVEFRRVADKTGSDVALNGLNVWSVPSPSSVWKSFDKMRCSVKFCHITHLQLPCSVIWEHTPQQKVGRRPQPPVSPEQVRLMTNVCCGGARFSKLDGVCPEENRETVIAGLEKLCDFAPWSHLKSGENLSDLRFVDSTYSWVIKFVRGIW